MFSKEEIYNFLFGEEQKEELRACRYNEPFLDYLKLSGRPEMENVRQLIAELIEILSTKQQQKEMLARMEKNDDSLHSAFFELFTKRYLESHGLTVIMHPFLFFTGNRPDFLVTCPDKTQFYVECVSVFEKENDQEFNKRKERLVEELNKLHIKDYGLDLIIIKAPPRHKSLKGLCKHIERKVQHLIKSNPTNREHIIYEEANIELSLYPSSSSNTVGTWGSVHNIEKEPDRIRLKLQTKAKKYGKLNKPYFIAINYYSPFVDHTTITDALLGNVRFTLQSSGNGKVRPDAHRDKCGLWLYNSQPIYTRVSGIITFHRVEPSTFHQCDPHVYINPWATRSISSSLFQSKTYTFNDCDFCLHMGRSITDILGISNEWPYKK